MADVELMQRYPHRTVNRAAWHVLRDGQLRPTYDRLLVEPDPREDQWQSGLCIPDVADDDARPQTGTVLAVGPDRRDVSVGDRVLFRRWGGTEVQVGGRDLLILWPRDVFATLQERHLDPLDPTDEETSHAY